MKHIIALTLVSMSTLIVGDAAADPAVGAPAPQCRSMTAWAPAQQFPANSTTPIRAEIYQASGTFDDFAPPELFVETDGGWEPVDYEVEPAQPENSQARHLVVDYQVGSYIVTWDSECGGEVSPVDPAMTVVGSFQVLEAAAPPAELGEASIEGEAFGGPFPTWEGSLAVELDDSWTPWFASSRWELELDGQRVWGPEGGAGWVRDNTFSGVYDHNCDDVTLPAGEYEAVIVAHAAGEEYRTESMPIEIVCLPPDDSRACSVGAAGAGGWLPLGVMFFAFARRRRRS